MKAEWKKVKLGEVTDSCLGKMLDKNKNKGTFQPYLANLNVRWGSFDLDNLSLMKFEPEEDERYGLQYGDLIVCEGGEPGRCAIWKNQIPNMKIQKALHRIRCHENVDYRFLFYWFLLAGKRGELKQYYTGATINHMPGDKLKTIEIYLPPLATQQKIASIISAYDDLIENNRKQIKLLEEAAQRLYKEWFVDLRFPGHEDVAIVNGVPEGWRKENIDKVYSIKYGKNLPTSEIQKKGKYPVYGASKMIGYYSQKNCDNYAVLITSRGNAGVVHRTHYQESFITNNSFIVLPQISSLHNVFIFFQMKQLKFESIVTGSCQRQLTNGLISQKKVIVPTNNILTKFNEETDCLFERIEILMKQNEYLAETRDRLLPKLISGELEV